MLKQSFQKKNGNLVPNLEESNSLNNLGQIESEDDNLRKGEINNGKEELIPNADCVKDFEEKDIFVVCQNKDFQSKFRLFCNIIEAEHYTIDIQNVDNDLFIIEEDDTNIDTVDLSLINRLFKSHKFITTKNALDAGLIEEISRDEQFKDNVGSESNNETNEQCGEDRINDFDSTSLFLTEE